MSIYLSQRKMFNVIKSYRLIIFKCQKDIINTKYIAKNLSEFINKHKNYNFFIRKKII